MRKVRLGLMSFFELGLPQGAMRHFLPRLPVVMRPRILNKGSNKKHNVDINALFNMPAYISSPIFIFQRDEKTLGILTEMMDRNGRNVCVAIEMKRVIQEGKDYIEVNDIRSIHGRRIENIVYPIISNGTLKWVDKEKGLAWLHSAKSNSKGITKQDTNKSHRNLSSASPDVQQEIDINDFDQAANIVENFENPRIEDKNDEMDEKQTRERTSDGVDSDTDAKEKHVVQLGSKLNIPVRIIRSEEEVKALPTRRDQRAKGWWSGWTGEVYSHAEDSIRKRIDALTDRMVNAEAERLHEEKRRAHEEAGRDSNAPYYGDMTEARVEAERKTRGIPQGGDRGIYGSSWRTHR